VGKAAGAYAFAQVRNGGRVAEEVLKAHGRSLTGSQGARERGSKGTREQGIEGAELAEHPRALDDQSAAVFPPRSFMRAEPMA
jgi:hypothetical protein